MKSAVKDMFSFTKKNKITYGVLMAIALVMLLASRYDWWMLPIFAAALCLVLFADPKKLEYLVLAAMGGVSLAVVQFIPKFKVSWLPRGPLMYGIILVVFAGIFFVKARYPKFMPVIRTALLSIYGPAFSLTVMHRIILEKEFYTRTAIGVLFINMILVAIGYFAVLVVTGRPKWAFYITHVVAMIIGLADYYVYEFRQNEIVFQDLDTIGTGLGVASKYRPDLNPRTAVALLFTTLVFIYLWKVSPDFKNLPGKLVIRVIALILCYNLYLYAPGRFMTLPTQTWEKKGTYRNGFLVNFLLGVRDSHVDPPTGYSADQIKELEEQYKAKETESSSEAESESETEANVSAQDSTAAGAANAKATAAFKAGEQPTIITIMNESFADFNVLGDLQTNEPVTPYIDSLKQNTTRGYALSSVFGAKTPNSEWEYMSGNSMAFLPSGSVVYQQYISKTPTTMVSQLKNEGYQTLAMHPYYMAGWSRNKVYPTMGFDEMQFMDNGNYFDENNIIRDYITDQEMFDKLINQYDMKISDGPLFIMGITMQNHGGYKDTYDNFTNDIHYTGSYVTYEDADQYLSLIHQTDDAVKNLIEYFQKVDKPVEIVFFGDHLPSLDAGFYRSLNGKGTAGLTLTELEELFTVPFFIWTNYESEEETVDITSLNNLSTLALQKAGIELDPYHQFHADMMESVPAMNSRAFYSKAQGKFLHYNEATGTEKEWIRKYEALQYNEMFDEENHSSFFFPYLTEIENAEEAKK